MRPYGVAEFTREEKRTVLSGNAIVNHVARRLGQARSNKAAGKRRLVLWRPNILLL